MLEQWLIIFVYKNFKVGKSLIEEDTQKIIQDIYKKAELNNCEIIIPEDCMVGTDFDGSGKNKNLVDILDNEIILDIGNNTIKTIQKRLINLIRFCGMVQLGILKMKISQEALCRLQKISLKILLKDL